MRAATIILCAIALAGCCKPTSYSATPLHGVVAATTCTMSGSTCVPVPAVALGRLEALYNADPAGWHLGTWSIPPSPVFHVSLTSSTGATAHFGIARTFVRQQDAVRDVEPSELEGVLAVALAETALACSPRCL